jgi:dipeptide transport system permease protein
MKYDMNLDDNLFQPVKDNFKDAEVLTRPSISYWPDVWRRLKKNKLAMAGLIAIVVLGLMAIIGPYLNGFTFYSQDFAVKNLRPNAVHWFGTDTMGRDLFTRTWYGARVSLFIGLMAAFIDLFIGVIYGGISGLKGGRVDIIMMRISEVIYSIPYLLVVILVSVFLPRGLPSIIFAMTITGWLLMGRLVRGQVLLLKEHEYVQASKIMGASSEWILRKHLIPNTMGPILVNMTLTIPAAIFAEATLSFLGLGVPPPLASWGTMASDALESLLVGNSYQLFIPAFFISITMLAFNVLGDGLRDALDPRLRK